MTKFNKLLIGIILTFFVIIVGLLAFVWGTIYGQNKATQIKVTSQSIFDKINNEAVLQTKSVYINQVSKITVDQGSEWSNFWWGQTIDAEALMKITIGVDLKTIKPADISIDSANKKIFIKLPAAKILETIPQGNVKVTPKSGVFKFLFANDTNQDYNQAITQLKADAASAVSTNPEILTDAQSETGKIISYLLSDTGYVITVL